LPGKKKEQNQISRDSIQLHIHKDTPTFTAHNKSWAKNSPFNLQRVLLHTISKFYLSEQLIKNIDSPTLKLFDEPQNQKCLISVICVAHLM